MLFVKLKILIKIIDIFIDIVGVFEYNYSMNETPLYLQNLPQNILEYMPMNCPECGSALHLSSTKTDLVCRNTRYCKAQILGRLSYFCGRNLANITGLSEKTLAKFVEKYEAIDVCDLYNLPFDKISEEEGFGSKSANKLQIAIQKSQEIAINKFLAGLGIDGVGPEVAKLICEIL